MSEIWKDIETIPYHQAKWPFHQISNLGRIRVLPGGIINNRTVIQTEFRILTKNSEGYIRVKQGADRTLMVHILVLNAFAGPCPPGLECRHLNGDPSDNRWPENIVWGSHKDNCLDRIRHGTNASRESHGSSKLTEADIIDIRSRLEVYGVLSKLAREYDVSHSTIWKIRNGWLWKSQQSMSKTCVIE